MNTKNIDIATMLDDLNLPVSALRWKEILSTPELANYAPPQLLREVIEPQYMEMMNNRYKGRYKGEVTGSDKRYSFSIAENCSTESVHLFESAIDLMSYATLLLLTGRDWKQDALLSLAGVYKTKRESVVPVALSRFLTDFPSIRTLRLHMDNDEIGRGAAKGIMDGLKGNYEVLDELPRYGKDVNDALQRRLALHRKKECIR